MLEGALRRTSPTRGVVRVEEAVMLEGALRLNSLRCNSHTDVEEALMLEGALRHSLLDAATVTIQLKRQSCSKGHCDVTYRRLSLVDSQS